MMERIHLSHFEFANASFAARLEPWQIFSVSSSFSFDIHFLSRVISFRVHFFVHAAVWVWNGFATTCT